MTRTERADLAQHMRRREKLAKADVDQQGAARLADFEAQLASKFRFGDAAWADVTTTAERLVKEADAKIAERCRELGIPAEFRPGLSLFWYGRGKNASASRGAELRKVAQTRIAALAKEAKVERKSLEVQAALLARGLASAEAKALLESMPTAESLMPRLALTDVEKSLVTPRALP